MVERNDALSQVAVNPKVCSRVHVLRVKHHACGPMRWSNALHSARDKLQFMPRLKIFFFAVLRPVQSLQKCFRSLAIAALSATADNSSHV